jgi:hypothetical protein
MVGRPGSAKVAPLRVPAEVGFFVAPRSPGVPGPGGSAPELSEDRESGGGIMGLFHPNATPLGDLYSCRATQTTCDPCSCSVSLLSHGQASVRGS